MPGLSCLWADFTTHEYAPHVHDAYVIATTVAGGAEFKSRGVVDHAETSRLLVFNPGEPHSGWMGASKRWRYRSFYLTDRAMMAICKGLGSERLPFFTRNALSDPDLSRRFLDLHRSMDEGTEPSKTRQLIYTSFARLFDRHSDAELPSKRAGKEPLIVRRTVEMLNEHYSQPVSLDDIADDLDVTPFHLIRVFTKQMGISPYAYLTQIRLKTACRHLKRGVSFAEAALAVGFYDQSALNKHFKKTYGITPSQFRNSCLS
ncbi:AraC family transcriptional regulator [Hoeflea poritis]|uniref:AraC family transcriptional regulator n=1 Tax=Hoeflea poritis TaxID=2993659 RepID=A0ABT4VK97_9HYPH|nr:AraC family transcriptional regulator [Hoeflea poritis]MDA4845128.1 AraC family transcriptional regulator [Hoeflea poritis]